MRDRLECGRLDRGISPRPFLLGSPKVQQHKLNLEGQLRPNFAEARRHLLIRQGHVHHGGPTPIAPVCSLAAWESLVDQNTLSPGTSASGFALNQQRECWSQQ
jgi:hypothetical protein